MSTAVEASLRTYLGADATLTALVGDRIYPGDIPDHDAPTPWLFYVVARSDPHVRLKGTAAKAKHTVELSALGETYSAAAAVGSRVRELLDDWAGDGTVGQCSWVSTERNPIDGGIEVLVTVELIGPAQ